MPHHEHVTIEGRIRDIFFHRFVIELKSGKTILADMGPKGVEVFPLETGMEIEADGEMKPSELKIERIARRGERSVVIEHHGPKHRGPKDHGPKHHDPKHHGPHHHHDKTDPDVAKCAVESAGFEAIGAPRRKPKHFEVLARKERRLVECHVEFDGHIRKEKPVAPDDHKWSDELSGGLAAA